MPEHFTPSLLRRLLHLGIAVVAIAWGVSLFARHLPIYFEVNWALPHLGDALSDFQGAQLLARGINPYTTEGWALTGNTYAIAHPPTSLLWFFPFVKLPISVVGQATSLLLFPMLLLHGYLCSRELRFPMPLALSFLFTAAVTSTSWLYDHFVLVQFSEPIALLYVLSWIALRHRRDVSSGICLGLAATLKFFPGLMILMLLLAKRYRAFAAAVVAYLAVFAMTLPGCGLSGWLHFLRAQGPTGQYWMGALRNSSLPGLVIRLFHPACRGQVVVTSVANTLAIILSLLLIALAYFVSRRAFALSKAGQENRIDLPFATFSLLSVFCNAWVWEHYYVLALQPMMLLFSIYGRSATTALRLWCERVCSTPRLLGTAFAAAIAISSLGLLVHVLGMNYVTRDVFQHHYRNNPLPFYHVQMHLAEAATFAPFVLPLILAFACVRMRGTAEQNY